MRTSKPTINHIAITKARINLGAVVERTHLEGEYFFEMRDPRVLEQIENSKKDQAAGRMRDSRELVSELKRKRAKVTKGRERSFQTK